MASSPNVSAPIVSFNALFAQFDGATGTIPSSPALQRFDPSQVTFDFDNDTPLRAAKPAGYARANSGTVCLFSPTAAESSLNAAIPPAVASSYVAPEPTVQVVDQTTTPDWDQHGFELPPLPFAGSVHSTPSRHVSFSGTPAQTPKGNVSFATPTTLRRKRVVSGLGSPSVPMSAGRVRTISNDSFALPPSPSPARRRVDSSSALTTNVPLSRNVSMQSRIFSGASTASFDIQSPSFDAFDAGDVIPGFPFSMPDLIGSQHPSPQFSQGKSPLATPSQIGGDVFYTSPAGLQQGGGSGFSLMTGVDHVMGPVPNSASMMSVESFQSQGHYRTNTLDTISETPLLEADQMPTLSFEQHHPTFQQNPVEYPAVPRATLRYNPNGPPAVDIAAWQNQAHMSTVGHSHSTWISGAPQQHPHAHAPHHAPHFMRTVSSGSVFPDSLGGPSMTHRSVSMPGSTAPSSSGMSIPGMPTAPGTTGLFGSDMDIPAPSRKRMHSASSSAITSPDTPRKKYPRIGNYIKPGPRPKGTTPKKSRSSSNPVSSPDHGDRAGGSINPALISGQQQSFGGMLQPHLAAAGPSNHHQQLQQQQQQARQQHQQSNPAIAFGRDLVEELAEAMSRSNSAQSVQPIMAPLPPAPQPQLVIQPARAAGAESQVSGLPRSFLETLYTTYLSTEGSHTGQPVKRFKCLIEGCERSFPRKSAIHSHIQTHLEDKPFQCEAEDCGAAFVRQHDLRRHMRIHSGTKPFPCPCGKGFARGDALARHKSRGICIGSTVPQRAARENSPRYDPYARPPNHIVSHHHPAMQQQQTTGFM